MEVQTYIQAIRNNWSSTYSVQATHRMLEVYLGFEEFVSIVPKTLLRSESPQFCETEPIETETIFGSSTMSDSIGPSSKFGHYSMSPFANPGILPPGMTSSSSNIQYFR